MTFPWQIFALGSAFFAALTALFGKLGVSGIPSNVATLVRTIVIFFLTLLIVIVRKEANWQSLREMSGSSLMFLLLSGLATGASWLLYYRALQLGDASRVASLDKLSLVFIVLLAALFLGEKPSLTAVAGAGLITAGSLLMVFAK